MSDCVRIGAALGPSACPSVRRSIGPPIARLASRQIVRPSDRLPSVRAFRQAFFKISETGGWGAGKWVGPTRV